jgi:hypothetical protein
MPPERERCTIGDGRGARTASLDRGGEFDPHRMRGEVRSNCGEYCSYFSANYCNYF